MISFWLIRVWMAFLWIQSTAGFTFTPSTGPFTNIHSIQRPTTELHWLRKKDKKNLVQPISMDSKNEKEKEPEPEPKDVYASVMEEDDNNDFSTNDNDIIDVPATEETVKPEQVEFNEDTDYDVIIVGAGCAGIGTALMLTRTFGLSTSRLKMIEQGTHVGESFRNWPEEMRFISPSFNQQGWTESFDLNSIHYDTSPAFTLRSEHPTGEEYAEYLDMIVEQAKLPVELETKVVNIQDVGMENKSEDYPGPFLVELSSDEEPSKIVTTRYIVWAAGEFQFPRGARNTPQKVNATSETQTNLETPAQDSDSETPQNDNENSEKTVNSGLSFTGADLCIHNSHVKSWAKLPGDDFIIIGGYESGIDAAVNLAKAGKKAKVIASTPCWNVRTGDPSSELAPYTSDRLRSVSAPTFSPRPKMYAPLRVVAVDQLPGGEYAVAARWKELDEEVLPISYSREGFRAQVPGEADTVKCFRTNHPPILCTGFEGSVTAQASHLFNFPDPNAIRKKACVGDGPLLTLQDESTKVKGVFLVGPMVSHGELSFCFVYKFRQRFAVVANAICSGLGMDTTAAVQECRQTNMYMDDFATCADTCGDAC